MVSNRVSVWFRVGVRVSIRVTNRVSIKFWVSIRVRVKILG